MWNFDWLAGVSQGTAKMIFFGLYIFIGLLISLLPNAYIYAGVKKEDRHWWNNLKYWSWAVLAILAGVYYQF